MNISDIAQKAGVSTATVSRVLNNSALVKSRTREQVLAVIEACGYTPSAVAKSLSVQATHNVGVIFPDIENPFFSSALKGITQVAEQNLYNVFFFNTDEAVWREHNFLAVARAQRLDGIIISPTDNRDKTTRNVLEEFERQGIAVVLFDRRLRDGCFSSVLAEDKKGACLAVRQMIAEGHKKIAIIAGSPSNTPVYERTKGYIQAMKEAGIPVRKEYILRADQKSELAYQAAKKLMESGDPPTAVFACNNMMTLGCLRCFTEKGIVIGRDISLMGFDDIETLRLIDFGLSVVNRSEREMGRLAMEVLLDRLKTPGQTPRIVKVPSYLILRGSEKLSSLGKE